MSLCINPRCDKPENPANAQFCQNCQSSLLLKQRYRALNILGEGGFGKTYEVSDLGTLHKVLKILMNNSPKAVELFQREAEFLSSHDSLGIPKAEQGSYFVFQPYDEQALVHCLVMEKVEGMNLRDYLKQLGHAIDSETAERWLKELLAILQEVHEQGILHRDIKPQNIIFKPDGRLALIDFGAVREGTGTQVATSAAGVGGTEVASHMAGRTTISSVGYTAPEQMNGEALRQSDFYSLGKTFIFLLTEKEPSEIPYDAHEDVLQWRKYANVEPKLANLIDQMTSTLVRQRPASIQDLLRSLNPQQTSRTTSSPQPQSKTVPPTNSDQRTEPKSPVPELSKTAKRKTSGVAIGSLVGVIAAGLGAIAISQNSSYQYPDPSQIPSDTVASDYPKPTCGSGGTAYRVYVDDPTQADYIRSNFCGDAWVNTYEGRQVVQVAQFGSEADVQNFVSFLQQQNIGSVFHAARNSSRNQSVGQQPTTAKEDSSPKMWVCYDQAGGFRGESREDLTGQSAEFDDGSTGILRCDPSPN